MHKLPDLQFEFALWQEGYTYIAGLDEAGRGAWAGPVVAGAVVLPVQPVPLDFAAANEEGYELLRRLDGVRDSKQLSARQRETFDALIRRVAVGVGLGMAGPEEIDRLGIVPATRLAMHRALEDLSIAPQVLLIDTLTLPDSPLPQKAIVHGDARCLSIAAASIVAKVARDRLMVTLDARYPGYGFARHKGYGTAQHRAALRALGPTPVHRRSFKPVLQALMAR